MPITPIHPHALRRRGQAEASPSPCSARRRAGASAPEHSGWGQAQGVLRGVLLGAFGLLAVAATAPRAQGAPAEAAPPETRSAAGTLSAAPAAAPGPAVTPRDTTRPPPPRTPGKFRLYTIENDKLLRELWKHAGREGAPEPGRYQALLYGEPDPRVLLLRDGTQAGTLPPETQVWLRDKIRTESGQSDDGATRTLG
jgi:hypothetical protein